MERIWIYQADRELTAADKAKVLDKLKLFTVEWKAHGRPLAAKAEVRYDRFIILMVDDAIAPPTGCSIDKSVYLLKEIEKETGLNLFDRLQMAYRKDNRIAVAQRREFEQLIAEGEVTGDTIVFNNLITSYPELETHWEVPMKESWHADVFL
ncbi:ABC transporter ATPase [Parapedobacter sp.]